MPGLADPPCIIFDAEEVNSLDWPFNCGPGALCAVLQVGPAHIRPHLRDFESKGYTNPSLMSAILAGLGLKYSRLPLKWPGYGLMRVQWDGPWCAYNAPIEARYRHTHWVAVCGQGHEALIFDVNATCVGGWISYLEWASRLVPWLLKEVEPRASGRWETTHRIQLDRDQALAVGRRLKKGLLP